VLAYDTPFIISAYDSQDTIIVEQMTLQKGSKNGDSLHGGVTIIIGKRFWSSERENATARWQCVNVIIICTKGVIGRASKQDYLGPSQIYFSLLLGKRL